MAVEDVTGRTVIEEQVIKVNEPKLIVTILTSRRLFVCIEMEKSKG